MKTLKIFSFVAFFMSIAQFSFAQAIQTETFNVSGNCGMCKSKIEKAAKDAGATSASWNATTKVLTVKYKSTSTNTAKIQQTIAGVGYDNAGFKATDAAYNQLHACCQYERSGEAIMSAACCGGEKTCKEDHAAMHAGAKPDCCKKSQ
jgi:periplasmic mercuric ion binding protein